jgi:hypothetical protein
MYMDDATTEEEHMAIAAEVANGAVLNGARKLVSV